MKSNQEWLTALKAGGMKQEAAWKELRTQLVRAVQTFLIKQAAAQSVGVDPVQMAEDCAQEAILLIRENLDGFRGESHFTTWTYAIALRTAFGELRRRKWQKVKLADHLIGKAPSDLPLSQDPPPSPGKLLEQERAWGLLRKLIETELTERQRTALVAHAFQEMPLDSVAEWLGANRDNVYKLIHDARKKLKRSLLGRGLTQADILKLFETDR